MYNFILFTIIFLLFLTVQFMKDEAPQLVNPLVESFVARHAKSSSPTPSVGWFPASHFADAAWHIEIVYISSFASTKSGFHLLYSIYVMNFEKAAICHWWQRKEGRCKRFINYIYNWDILELSWPQTNESPMARP